MGDLGGALRGLPDDAQASILARSAPGRHWATVLREIATLEELDASVASLSTFDGLPVLVIAADAPSPGESAEARAAWFALQKDLVAISNAARLQVVDGSDHLSLLFDADHAAEVARGIAMLAASTSVSLGDAAP